VCILSLRLLFDSTSSQAYNRMPKTNSNSSASVLVRLILNNSLNSISISSRLHQWSYAIISNSQLPSVELNEWFLSLNKIWIGESGLDYVYDFGLNLIFVLERCWNALTFSVVKQFINSRTEIVLKVCTDSDPIKS